MPDTGLGLNALNQFSKELNGSLAHMLMAEDVPPPVKEAFYAFQECLKGLHDISIYVGDHCFTLRFEGFDFSKFLLPKHELLQLNYDTTDALLQKLFSGTLRSGSMAGSNCLQEVLIRLLNVEPNSGHSSWVSR